MFIFQNFVVFKLCIKNKFMNYVLNNIQFEQNLTCTHLQSNSKIFQVM